MGLFKNIGNSISAAVKTVTNSPNLLLSMIPGMGEYVGQQEANAANAQQAAKQMEFQREMSNTAHQREAADLKAAGLNPIMAANQGAATPSGTMATMGNTMAAGGLSQSTAKAMEAVRLKNELEIAEKNKDLLDNQISKTKAEEHKADSDRFLNEQTWNLRAPELAHQDLKKNVIRDAYVTEMQMNSAKRQQAIVDKKRGEFDEKAVKYDGYASRVGQAVGTINNAASVIKPSIQLHNHVEKTRGSIRVDPKTGEILK